MCSIFRKAGVSLEEVKLGYGDLSLLVDERERSLIQQLGHFPSVVSGAARARAPHLICEYLDRTAGEVNSWYHAGNPTRDPTLAVLVDDSALRQARLLLVQAVRIVLRNGLHLLGLEAPEQMARNASPDEEDQ
jgi:arginyl-tRNA synthetase